MSIGVCAYGAYVPAYRLAREVIAEAMGGRSLGGERAVANYDEDALTMGVEASLECLDNYGRAWGSARAGEELQGLLFASSSSPYREKHAASVMGSVLEIEPTALVTDLTSGLRGALTAVDLACHFLGERGKEAKALVVAADRRAAEPGSHEEQAFGDGAAALLLGKERLLATVEGRFVVNANFPHFWRRENDLHVRSGDTRFVEKHGYLPLMREAISGLLEKTGLSAAEVAKLVVYAPDSRLGQRLAGRLGFDVEKQLASTFFNRTGDTGVPQVFLSLIDVLSSAKPEETIIVAGYGDGAEAILLRTTERIQRAQVCQGVQAQLKRSRYLTRYAKYLHFRDALGESSYDAFSSLALLWREEKQNLGLYAVRCPHCGAIAFPRRRVCHTCGTKDGMEDFKLSRRGHVYTFTNDYVYINPDPPETLAAVDLQDGGRFFGQLTDTDPQEVRIGMEVALSFRKLHDGQGLPNYFWKARPATREA